MALENKYKAFHFQEVDWLICFPVCGNSGKYCRYRVFLIERKGGSMRREQMVMLGEVLDRPEIDQHYPHTVGYFKSSLKDAAAFEPEYLELRGINSVEEFWMFLNSVNL